MLACNCYVLAPHAGADAIVVDPGQRAMGNLRRILDENRLTPAAVLLTHGHIDHMWSAQKVGDTFGCPVFIHPEDRFMLADPIRGIRAQAGPDRVRRAVPRAQAGRRTRPRRGQTRARRHHGDRRPHARPHPRVGGVSGRPAVPAGRSQRPGDNLSRSPATRCSSRRWAAPTCPAAAGGTCSARSSKNYWCSTTTPWYYRGTVNPPPSVSNAVPTHSSKV